MWRVSERPLYSEGSYLASSSGVPRDVGRGLKNHRLATYDEQGPQRDGEGIFAGMRGNDRVAPKGAIRRAVGNRPNPALIISRPSVRLFSTLFVYPDVFETPAVEQAVHHDCEPLNPWLPAHCKTAIKDDRLDVVLGQFPFDFPYQLLAFIGIGLR